MKVRPTIARPQLRPTSSCRNDDHRVGDVDQRLEDVRERDQAAASRCSWRAAVVAEEAAVGELVDAAVAPRVAARQAPGGDDRAADNAELTHGLDRVGRAGRVVLAAVRQRRRDQAPVERAPGARSSSRRARARAESGFVTRTVSRVTPPRAPTRRAARRAPPPAGRSLTLDQTCRVRAGDEDEVVTGGQPRSSAQKASRRARLTALRSTAPPTLRLTEIPSRSSPSAPSRSARGTRRGRGSGSRASGRRGRRGRSHRCATGGRASCARVIGVAYGVRRLRPLRRRRRITSRPAARPHPGPEPVGACALALLRLPGALHEEAPVYRAGALARAPVGTVGLLPANCGVSAGRRPRGPDVWSARVSAGRRPPDDLDDLWRRVRGELEASLPSSTFSLWLEPLRAVSIQGTTLLLSAPPLGADLGRAPLRGDAQAGARSARRRESPGSASSTSARRGPRAGAGAPAVAAARPRAHVRPLRDRRRATGSPTPPRSRSPSFPARPTTRSSSTARRGSARPTCSARSRLHAAQPPRAGRPLHDRRAVHERVRRRAAPRRARSCSRRATASSTRC